jgi:hypothetical protein
MTTERGVPELVTELMAHVEDLKKARAMETDSIGAASALLLELEKMDFRITIPELQFMVDPVAKPAPDLQEVAVVPISPEGVLVATTPVPASLGANLAAGRPAEEDSSPVQDGSPDREIDREMSEDEWLAEVARRGAGFQDSRSAEAIHHESRVTPEAAATGLGGFRANIGVNYEKVIAAGLSRSAVLGRRLTTGGS